MSRHRNVRSMNYSEEYDGYDDVYGHSVEDDYTISPSDAAFMYDRSSRQPLMSIYLKGEEDIAEEDEQPTKDSTVEIHSEIDNEKLAGCLEAVKNVMGDTYSEQVLINTILEKKYDTEAVVDALLNKVSFSKREGTDSPKPQRLTTLRSSERGESENVKKNSNSGKLQDTTPIDKSLTEKMDIDYCLLNKYKNFEIDFSKVLIKTPLTNRNNQIDYNNLENEGVGPSINKDNHQVINDNNSIVKISENSKTSFKRHQHPLYTSYLSKVGYYLCMKYIEMPLQMKLNKEIQSAITPFKFDTRSPDEVTKKAFVVIKKSEHKFKF